MTVRHNRFRRSTAALCTVVAAAAALLLGSNTVASAAATTVFQVPLTYGSGSSRSAPVVVAATAGVTPGITTFSVLNPQPVGGEWAGGSSRNAVRVQWLNLATGATGAVDLGYRAFTPEQCGSNYTMCHPAALEAATGSGQIAATVTMVGPDGALTLVPGFGTFAA